MDDLVSKLSECKYHLRNLLEQNRALLTEREWLHARIVHLELENQTFRAHGVPLESRPYFDGPLANGAGGGSPFG
jgi:regulator of replication initiation timing